MRRGRVAVGVALVAMVIVAGCSAGGDDGGGSAGGEAQVAPTADQAATDQDRSAQAAPAGQAAEAEAGHEGGHDCRPRLRGVAEYQHQLA